MPDDGTCPDAQMRGSQPADRGPEYRVRLTVGNQTWEERFEVLKDPLVPASVADLEAQYQLMLDIRRRVLEVADLVLEIRETRVAVTAEAPPPGGTILQQLDEIEGVLTIWMGSEAHPMMFGPP